MEQRTLIYGFALIALAAGTWWLQSDSDKGDDESAGTGQSPDYIVEGFKVTNMDEKGQPHRRLVAQKMMHYEHNDTAELIEPVITVFEDAGPLWLIRSETGHLTSGKERIELRGKVTVDQTKAKAPNPIHMVTRNLVVLRNKNYAETDQHVEITSGRDRLEGVGMNLWFEEPMRMKLLSSTRAHYQIGLNRK